MATQAPQALAPEQLRLPRLKPTIEVIPGDDGSLYLYRGIGSDFTIPECPGWALTLLELLDGSLARVELPAALRRAGCAEVDDQEVHEVVAQLHGLALVEDAAGDARLAAPERERYERQLRYFSDLGEPGVDRAEHQLRLRDAHVALLGLGGLGGCAALTLAAAGVGRIDACDGDVVELSNLNRQVLYSTSDVGTPKAEAAARRVAALNPEVDFRAEQRWLDGPEDVEEAIAGADLVVDAVDRPAHEIERWVDSVCFGAGVPYIAMSQSPPFVRIGPMYVPGRTGCYRCQEAAWRERHELFDEIAAKRQASSPVSATGPAAGVVGALVTMEVIHFLTGLAEPSTLGAAVIFDLRSLTTRRSEVRQLPDCEACHALTAR